MIEMLWEEGIDLEGIGNRDMIDAKKEKVKEYMIYSIKNGTLEL